MAIKVAAPAPVAAPVAVEKYPVEIIQGEYQGKPTLRVTTNPKNFKFDTFSGGATKLKNLFKSDKDGDVVIASLAKWLIEQGTMTQDELVSWFERLSAQISDSLSSDCMIPV